MTVFDDPSVRKTGLNACEKTSGVEVDVGKTREGPRARERKYKFYIINGSPN